MMASIPLTIARIPRPEHATHAIWAGRAARSRVAASTDRGWASTSDSVSASGDDPELDQLLEAAKEEEETEARVYYDMFGRRRVEGGTGVAVRARARPGKMRQSRVVALALIGIVGPLAALGIAALRPKNGAAGALSAGSAAAVSAGAMVAAGPVERGAGVAGVEDGGAPRVVEDAGVGAGVRGVSSGARPGVGPKLGPKRPKSTTDDPYNEPAKKPPALVY